MTKCAVEWCKNYTNKNKTTNLSFHIFPRDPERKRQWVDAIGREDSWIPTMHSQICSLHFHPNNFNITCHKQRKLLKSAVPSLCLPMHSQGQSIKLEHLQEQQDTSADATINSVQNAENTSENNVRLQLDTPRMQLLRKKVIEQRKKIKKLQYRNRNLRKKAGQLEDMIENLTKNCINTDVTDGLDILEEK